MAGGGGWNYYRRFLERLGMPESWTWGVLVGSIVAAVIGAALDLHGVVLALWCVAAVVVLALLIPYAWRPTRDARRL